MFSCYNMLLHKHPITIKMFTSGVLFSLSDAISQIYIQKKQYFNLINNIQRFIIGAFYMGPSLILWYSKTLPHLQSLIFLPTSTKIVKVLGSVLMTQLIFSPLLIIGFFLSNQFVKNPSIQSLKAGFQQCKIKFFQTLKCNWLVWSLATSIIKKNSEIFHVFCMYLLKYNNKNIILKGICTSKCQKSKKSPQLLKLRTGLNLWFMPFQYQVVFSNILGFFWNIFLCFITSSHGNIQFPSVQIQNNLQQMSINL